MTRKYRSAIDGSYVSREHAESHPDTTVSEDDSRVVELERRVMQLEAAVEWLLKGMGAPRPTL